ncbi:MAG: hypothetical protein A4E53_03909 [Pelotomaculum sp. PtaB.Bin104]|nr:MAG: hypothetical protein A4E53_03909 [Pelotomaculum sp. PtaB.Bin104]
MYHALFFLVSEMGLEPVQNLISFSLHVFQDDQADR